jgi:hypothetical protein
MVPALRPEGKPCNKWAKLCGMSHSESYSSGNVCYKDCIGKENPVKKERNCVERLIANRMVLVMYGTGSASGWNTLPNI